MWFDRPLPDLIRTGTVRRLHDIPLDAIDAHLGIWCAYYEADLSFRARNGEVHARDHTFAGLAADPHQAQFFCMMEAAERCSGLSAEVMEALAFRGGQGPGWEMFSPYTEAEWRWNRCYPDGRPEWRVQAFGIRSGRSLAVPADSVFPWWRSFSGRVSPLPESDGGGFAAGFTWEKASHLDRALAEVIERDACMLSWRVDAWPARTLPVERLAGLGLLQHARQNGLQVELYDIGDPDLAPVVIALLSRDGTELVIGASCQRDLGRAASKAVREALMLRGTAALLASQTGPLAADDISDSAEHIVYAWRNSGPILDWYRRKARLGWPPSGPGDVLAARSEDVFSHEPLLVDVTHPDLVTHHIRVVRVLQPHAFRKEYRHVFRYRGGLRLARLGIAPDALNPLPHAIG